MRLLRHILRESGSAVVVIAVASLVSGVCSTGLLAFVNRSIHDPGRSSAWLAAGFAALGLSKVLSSFVSEVLLIRFTESKMALLRMDLVRKILGVPLRDLEEVGTPKLLAALTDDINRISNAFLIVPFVATNGAMLVGGAIYLAWLSWQILLAAIVFILFGLATHQVLIRQSKRFLKMVREQEDRLFGHFAALTQGIKELKLHRQRRRAFLSECLSDTTETYRKHTIAAEWRYSLAQGTTQLFLYALIGLIVFAMPKLASAESETLTGYVITIIFLMGPMQAIVSVLPRVTRADVSLQKVEDLGLSLAALNREDGAPTGPEYAGNWKSIELKGVTHSYHREREDDHFTLGPIDLSFKPGELVFLVGGNGSGKTTLAKIVIGLYPPEEGGILLDGQPITDQNRDNYRQLFSAIFSDFFLFESLLGLDSKKLDRQAREYLEQLHLDHKVTIDEGRLSTTALSQGQRKRLALLTAYLEDRPFYMFDEWAASQDPEFKEVFYTKILPELKTRGKTILVISHDDRYFHLADRVIRMEEGKLL